MALQLFYLINQFAGENRLLDLGMTLLSEHGAALFVLVLVGAWVLQGKDENDNHHAVPLALLVVCMALSFNQLIELFYFRPRPFVLNHVTLLIEKSAHSTSFPSNHSAGAFAIAFVFLWQQRVLGFALLGLAALLAFSRIFVGVHYPLDILAGALSALLATALVYWQHARIQALTRHFPTLIPLKETLKRKRL
jgi:undecaprenyl-diphosphatase